MFTNWCEERKMTSVWVAERYNSDSDCPTPLPAFFGALPTSVPIHPVPGRDASPCVTPGTGTWRNKLYHFHPDAPPSSGGDESHTEYFIPYQHFKEGLEALFVIRHHFRHLV